MSRPNAAGDAAGRENEAVFRQSAVKADAGHPSGQAGGGGTAAIAPVTAGHPAGDDVRISIKTPELLQICGGRPVSYGAHQLWYHSPFGKMGGCGPTAASNLLWYLTAAHPEFCRCLFDGNGCTRPGMQRLMNEVWRYVKPGMRGVDKAAMLADGAVQFGAVHGVALHARVMEIPAIVSQRPSAHAVYRFLAEAFAADLPAAFLNLSNGEVKNLDNWHWVTLISVDRKLQAEMYDQSRRQYIDLALWLETTTKGGAFVALEPDISKEKGENKMTIARTTTIGDILDYDTSTAKYFMEIGMHCLGCPASRGESIEQACAVHGTDADALVAKLNNHFQSK